MLVASTSGQRVPGQTVTGNVPSNVSDQLAAAQQDIAQGKAVDALKLYDQVLKQDPNNAQALTFRGWILESANLHDEALQSLDKAYEEHAGFMPYVSLDPRLKPLWRDRRFQDLLHRIGLPNQEA